MIHCRLNRHHCLSTSEFKVEYHDKRFPVIISDSFDWQATKKWNSDYFQTHYNDKTVDLDFYEVMEKKWGTKEVKLPQALDLIHHNTNKNRKHYLMQKSIKEEFPDILQDFQLPRYANEEAKHYINLWWGEAGIISQAHYDCSDNFLTQIMGTKQVKLFAPTESANLYSYGIEENFLGDKTATHISKVQEFEVANLYQFPNLNKVTCYEGTLNPGDLLYIPSGWWHEIKSLETSISVNFWWLKKLFELSTFQATQWICSTYFYFSNDNFDNIMNMLFDCSSFQDDIEIAEASLSRNWRSVAAVFLLNHLHKISKIPLENEKQKMVDTFTEWKQYLSLAKSADDNLLDKKKILNIITELKDQ